MAFEPPVTWSLISFPIYSAPDKLSTLQLLKKNRYAIASGIFFLGYSFSRQPADFLVHQL